MLIKKCVNVKNFIDDVLYLSIFHFWICFDEVKFLRHMDRSANYQKNSSIVKTEWKKKKNKKLYD